MCLSACAGDTSETATHGGPVAGLGISRACAPSDELCVDHTDAARLDDDESWSERGLRLTGSMGENVRWFVASAPAAAVELESSGVAACGFSPVGLDCHEGTLATYEVDGQPWMGCCALDAERATLVFGRVGVELEDLYVRLVDVHAANADYDLTVRFREHRLGANEPANDALEGAVDLGPLSATRGQAGGLGRDGDVDFYRFTPMTESVAFEAFASGLSSGLVRACLFGATVSCDVGEPASDGELAGCCAPLDGEGVVTATGDVFVRIEGDYRGGYVAYLNPR
jgi:hypothetical protein